VTTQTEPGPSHNDMRIYLSDCKKLRLERERQELNSNKQKIFTTKSVLFEKARNASLLWAELKVNKIQENAVVQPEGLNKLKE